MKQTRLGEHASEQGKLLDSIEGGGRGEEEEEGFGPPQLGAEVGGTLVLSLTQQASAWAEEDTPSPAIGEGNGVEATWHYYSPSFSAPPP